MSDDFGACVVLIPESNDLPNTVAGGQHVTLAYFGDTMLSDDLFMDLVNIVYDLAKSRDTIIAKPSGFELFGENKEAHVLTFENEPLETIRNELLAALTPDLRAIFEESETFPDYRPHMTLGYTNEGYQPGPMDIAKPFSLSMVAMSVWNGEVREEILIGEDLPPMTHQEALAHSGVLRKSGRYPWGSGETPNQRNKQFLNYVDDLHKKGMTQTQIAEGFGMTTTQLRAAKSIAKNEQKAALISQVSRLKEKQMSNIAIGEQLGIPESSVRALLAPETKARNDELLAVANLLKDQVAEKKYLDVGLGTENHIGISGTKLATAVAQLKEEDYQLHKIKVQQLGTGEYTEMKVLVGPDTTFKELVNNQDKIRSFTDYSDEGGPTGLGLRTPENVDSKRLQVRYAEDGGTDMDGVIELRRGVKDLDMGNARYAQVRIAVDGTHYLKGMAVYADDLPDGVDLRFNTNKSKDVAKIDTLKKMKTDQDGVIDKDNPFGSQIKPGGQKGALNIVNEEGDWYNWSKKISSQMMSKQMPSLAKEQLGLAFDIKKQEYDDIMALTNPAVRTKLLTSFADAADSSAVHLKAAGLPRTRSHVILPVVDMKDSEIYAPQYRDGERVVLIRHPHGGIFEIPELTVNNRQPTAKGLLGQAKDAVGISPKTAEQLSGADFDGDTVLVIPNPHGAIKTSAPLKGLKGFDPKASYPAYEGMKKMDTRGTQSEMGNISNLITDMTIKLAPTSEIVRAVRHSMVVIDAEKHGLNYKQSALDNNIIELKKKYQKSGRGGADTLISKASSEQSVLARKARPAKEGGPIDPATGEKRYVETGESYVNREGKTVQKKQRSTKMAEARDAYDLSSGTPMEAVYADHANKLKAMGNQARKSIYETKPLKQDASAKIAYAPEVNSLKGKLNVALKNKPLERQAQLLANATVSAKKQANPDMDKDDLKKIKGMAQAEARLRTGAKKQQIDITENEWAAIQSGAISNNFLKNILDNTDVELVKQLATPRDKPVMSDAKIARAQSMLSRGYTQSEIADALGVPTSTLNDSIQ